MTLRVLSLFSGIGGFDLGFERAGMKTVRFVEIDPFCQKVLRKHWPDVPITGDITTAEFTKGEADVVCGGSPCQDISKGNAVWGERLGLDGERSGLFFEYIRCVDVVRPLYAALENVTALLGDQFGRVLGALADIGYNAEWRRMGAYEVGSPQARDRLVLIAYPHSAGRKGLVESFDLGAPGQGREGSAEDLFASDPFMPGDSWPQPLLRRMDGRVPDRLDRIKTCGNSIHPGIAEVIGRAIVADYEGIQRGQMSCPKSA